MAKRVPYNEVKWDEVRKHSDLSVKKIQEKFNISTKTYYKGFRNGLFDKYKKPVALVGSEKEVNKKLEEYGVNCCVVWVYPLSDRDIEEENKLDELIKDMNDYNW